jgi:protein-S-isoprenylcysteine O-methyltransferase Ste14
MVAIAIAAWRFSLAPATADAVTPARLVGTVVLLVGLALITAGSWVLRRARSFSVLPRPVESGMLVEAGPYRWVRHPLYVGVVLAAIGGAIYRESLVAGALTVALAVVLDLKRRREETWLLGRFPAYAEYRERTKAWVPFVY